MTMTKVLSRPSARLILVVGLQLLLLFGVLAFKQYTVWTGTTVLLAVEPLDPVDPFRGEYLEVRYEISRIEMPPDEEGFPVFGDVWVELQEGDDGFWHAVAIHDRRTHDFLNTVIIKGNVVSTSFDWERDGEAPRPADMIQYEIEYGIETFFIPEGSAGQIPQSTEGKPLGIEVKVDRFGNAVPRHLVFDGTRLDLRRR